MEEVDQEASKCEGTDEDMAPRLGPDVLESRSESKNLPLDELSANTKAMLTTLLVYLYPNTAHGSHKLLVEWSSTMHYMDVLRLVVFGTIFFEIY
jgi:hypothetical protein